MAASAANLCTERHYMGSAASGRYVTDRAAARPFWHPPYPEVVEQLRASQTASRTRYLRQAGVVRIVVDYERALCRIVECDAKLDAMALAQGEPADSACERAEYVRRVRDEAVALKREASRQLRLIGITPQEQALIRDELSLRIARSTAAAQRDV